MRAEQQEYEHLCKNSRQLQQKNVSTKMISVERVCFYALVCACLPLYKKSHNPRPSPLPPEPSYLSHPLTFTIIFTSMILRILCMYHSGKVRRLFIVWPILMGNLTICLDGKRDLLRYVQQSLSSTKRGAEHQS